MLILADGLQLWGAGLLDQLLRSRLVEPEECLDHLRMIDGHANGNAPEKAVFIRYVPQDRE